MNGDDAHSYGFPAGAFVKHDTMEGQKRTASSKLHRRYKTCRSCSRRSKESLMCMILGCMRSPTPIADMQEKARNAVTPLCFR